MAIDLYALADSVSDEQGFLNFLTAMAADRAAELELERAKPSSPYAPGALGWENGSIEGMLDAAAAWGSASPVYYVKPDNPWRRAAHILHAGKFYE